MKYFKIFLVSISLTFFSCEDFLDVNDNPNQLTSVPNGELLLLGTQLANVQLHKGHLMRAAMYYSGQLIGVNLVQQTLYVYNFTPGDSDGSWRHLYNGILVDNKEIRALSPNNAPLQGIIDINEAMAMGTATSIWGDVPYSTAIPDNPGLSSAPASFDSQSSVFAAVQALLDRGISTLQNAETAIPSNIDNFNSGNLINWVEAAYTLKARNYLLNRDYNQALANVVNGVSNPANNTNYNPIGNINENSNLMYILVNGSRAGDMTGEGAYYRLLLDPNNPDSRNNSKTNEAARWQYTYVSGDGSQEDGIDDATTPMPLVTYEENTLIWAECLARTGDIEGALSKLNELRAYYNSGDAFPQLDDALGFRYEPYVLADFEAGGIENVDGIAIDRALLREIIEERYVTGFLSYMPFDDVRRLQGGGDSDLVVPFPLNTDDATRNPQRILYPQSEIDRNPNVPNPLPNLFTETPVNN